MEASSPSAATASSPQNFCPVNIRRQAASTRSVAALSSNLAIDGAESAAFSSSTRIRSSRSRNGSQTTRKSSESSRSGPATRSGRHTKRRSSDQGSASTSPPPLSDSQRPRKRARLNLKKPPPPQAEIAEDEKKPSPAESCCICMCEVKPDDLAGISGCEHRFCFGCIEKWAERENTCPLCKNRFNKIDRINKKRKKGQKNTKRVKQRDQRSDLVPGAALEGLLGRLLEDSHPHLFQYIHDLTELLSTASFASRGNHPSIARLIFSGIGNLEPLNGTQARFSHTRTVRLGETDDSDDEESPFSSFLRALNGREIVGVPLTRVPLSQALTFTTRTTSRSYASNSNDSTAGNMAENPLEINDSDDDVGFGDDEVWISQNNIS